MCKLYINNSSQLKPKHFLTSVISVLAFRQNIFIDTPTSVLHRLNISLFRDERFLLISGFPFFSKIFGNEMSQTWSIQLDNGGIQVLNREFPLLFSSESTFISVHSLTNKCKKKSPLSILSQFSTLFLVWVTHNYPQVIDRQT